MNKRFRNSNKIDLPHDIDQESLLSLYDRESKDLELFNSIDAEIIKLSGSKLFYYKVFINENYDRVYLEERNKVVSKDAIVVWASYDPKPIEENVSEFGLELTNDQVFVFNKSYIERAIGRAPQPGDVVESPVQNIKYEIYEVQEDSFEVYGVFHYNCYGRILRDSSDVVDEPALETFEEVGADLLFTRSDYEDLSVAAMTNPDIIAPESPPVIVPDPDENILALFANGEVGAWYDPSDLTTVFQDAAGTTPANVGDPVGLILDKSQGGVGATNQMPATSASDWVVLGSNTATDEVDGSVLITHVDANDAAYIVLNSFYAGIQDTTKSHKITFEAKTTGGSSAAVLNGTSLGSPQQAVDSAGYQAFSFIVKWSGSGAMSLQINMSAGKTINIRSVSVYELPGNHATQTTSAARPVLQQSGDLYYLDFDGVDDTLFTNEISPALAQPNTLSASFVYNQEATQYIWDSWSTAARNALAYATGASPSLLIYATASGTNVPVSSFVGVGHVAVAEYNTNQSVLRLDGAAIADPANVGASGTNGYRLARAAFPGGYGNIDMFAFVAINRTLTAAEITDLETYLAEKSGVTLATPPVNP